MKAVALLLLVLVIGSSLYLVKTSYESRRLFALLDRARGEQRALVLAAKIGREQVSLGDRSRAQRLHFRARDHELGVVAPGDIGDVLLLAEPQDLPLAAAIQWHDLEHRLHAIGRWHGKGDMLAVRRQRDLGNFRVLGKVHVTGRLRDRLRGCK